MNFKKNANSVNQRYDVWNNGEYIGQVYKTMFIDRTILWKNNHSEELHSTRKEATDDLLEN